MVCLFCALLVGVPIVPAEACSSSPGNAFLTGFSSELSSPASRFYAAAEDLANATTMISIFPGDCTGTTAEAQYTTEDGSATGTEDYAPTSGTTQTMCNDVHYDQYCGEGPPPTRHVQIPLIHGPQEPTTPESAVESFTFRVTGGTAGVTDPSSAPVHLIDVDGTERFSLEPLVDGSAARSYSRSESLPTIRIPVFRAGPVAAPGTITYDAQGSGANPATAGEDFDLSTTSLNFPAGDRIEYLQVQILADLQVEQPETFDITLTGPNAAAPSTTTITIVDDDSDVWAPVTRFHHPKNGLRYPYGDYRLREMHVFVKQNQGNSPLVKVHMSLMRKLENGSCQWWRQGRFRTGPCASKRWVGMTFDGFDLHIRRFPSLRPTQGTPIRYYKAWSRAVDGAKNIETTFTAGRNANQFWITR